MNKCNACRSAGRPSELSRISQRDLGSNTMNSLPVIQVCLVEDIQSGKNLSRPRETRDSYAFNVVAQNKQLKLFLVFQ